MQSFILPANGAATPKSIERKRKMAEAMLASGMDASPIASPWQGAARMAQALVGGLGARKADQAESAGMSSSREGILKALGNGGTGADVANAAMNPFTDNNSMELLGARYKQLNPAPLQPTDDMQEYNFSKTDPAFAEYQLGLKRAGANNMTVDMKGENAYAVDRGKDFAKRAGEIDTGEQAAFKTINSLNQMENLIQDPSFYSGFGADQLQAVKSAAVSLGADPNSVNSMEQFNTLSKQTALDTMGGSLGTGFSNADRDFVVGQVPNLQNTPAGNKAVIAINRKMQERKIQIAKMARKYEIEHGRLDPGFMQELSDWAEQNPLFAGEAQQMPQPTQQGGAVPQSPQGDPNDPLGLRK